MVRSPDKISNKILSRIIIDLLRRPHLKNSSLLHYGNPVRDRQRLLLVMGNKKSRDPRLLLDRPDLFPHLRSKRYI